MYLTAKMGEDRTFAITMWTSWTDPTPIASLDVSAPAPQYAIYMGVLRPFPPGSGALEAASVTVNVSAPLLDATAALVGHRVTIDKSTWTVPGTYVFYPYIADVSSPFVAIPAAGVHPPIYIEVTSRPDTSLVYVLSAESVNSILISPEALAPGLSNHWKGSYVQFLSGSLRKQQRKILTSTELVAPFTAGQYDDTGHVSGERYLLAGDAFANYAHVASTFFLRLYPNFQLSLASFTTDFYEIGTSIDESRVLLADSLGGDADNVTSGGITRITFADPLTEVPAQGDLGIIIAE